MPEHTVQQGECLSSIADSYGLFWETIWNDSRNAQLKQQRQDPNVLYAGDSLFVPDKRVKQESGATEQRHRFRKKGTPAKLRVQILVDDQPRANEPYRLRVDGRWFEGTTDGQGYIEKSIPPGAREGLICVGEGDQQDAYKVRFGTVDPIDTDEGVAGRLRDLGFCVDEDYEAAVKAFQEKEELEPTGTVDDATRGRLRERFGQ